MFHLWIGMFRAENKIEMKLLEGGNDKLLKNEKEKKGDDNCTVLRDGVQERKGGR